MNTIPPSNKSTLKEIENRFDHDVERFSNLSTGQVSTVDAALSLELVTQAVAQIVPQATFVLDLGCGAGNFAMMLLKEIPDFDVTLVDLSKPMLDKAVERISLVSKGGITAIQSDFMSLDLPADQFDAVVTGAALHHLRDDDEWNTLFKKVYHSLKKGGCFVISDLVNHNIPQINQMMWQRYANYLISTGGNDYQKNVFDYIEKEDTPRSIDFQLELMKKVGFSTTDILHKNSCFGVFAGVK